MFQFYADDGRVLTPPKELEPLLNDSYKAFYNLLGHIRFYYVVNEIWDGSARLIFKFDNLVLAEINLKSNLFSIKICSDEFFITHESQLNDVFSSLEKDDFSSMKRPHNQLLVDLNEYPNGIRCDMCQIYVLNNIDNDFAGNKKFFSGDRNCYYGVKEGWGIGEFSTGTCKGKDGCYLKTYNCLERKGFKNCLECGQYHTCNECGVGHNPGECNLGITAEEVTALILPYCDVERLDFMKNYTTQLS